MIGLDTNVLLRWLVDDDLWPADDREQIAAADALLSDSQTTFFVNLVVLAEVVWVLLHPMKQPKAIVVQILDTLLRSANVMLQQPEVVAAATDAYRRGKPGFTDHLIGHVNRHAGCKTTVSFDKGARGSDVFTHLAPSAQ